ncbi:MAG: histidinol-phosphate transaminase [Campylobacterales bacterium]|nr:histidinol-phosphate transaminase [Campylobacterales bacterium]
MKFNDTLDEIKLYEAGKPIELVVREFGVPKEQVVKLASNENPLGASKRVQDVICAFASRANLYPDDSMYELKEGLAKKFDVASSQIAIGAGSDQILEFVSRALLGKEDSVLMSQVTFAMYEIYAKQMGARVLRTPSYEHKVDEFLELYKKHKPKVIYLCIPNNPTGDAMKKSDAFEIIDAVDKETLIVVDCAYMEYAAYKDSAYKIEPKDILNLPNVIYLGTFSKAYGLGGMRVGYGIANEKIIHNILKMRPPFNISTLSLAAAIEALKDEVHLEETLKLHTEQIKRYEVFAKENGIKYIESYTNFITYLFDEKYNSSDIANKLLQKGVIVRDLASYKLNAIRITIGTEAQNDIFFERLLEVMDLK